MLFSQVIIGVNMFVSCPWFCLCFIELLGLGAYYSEESIELKFGHVFMIV